MRDAPHLGVWLMNTVNKTCIGFMSRFFRADPLNPKPQTLNPKPIRLLFIPGLPGSGLAVQDFGFGIASSVRGTRFIMGLGFRV